MNSNKSAKDIAKKGLDNLLSNKNQSIVDVMRIQKNVHVNSSDVLVEEVQKRVWSALKHDQQYSDITTDSDRFLRENVFSSTKMIVMYVDLVGSTQMVMDLPQKQLAMIISSFAQEMGYVVKQHMDTS